MEQQEHLAEQQECYEFLDLSDVDVRERDQLATTLYARDESEEPATEDEDLNHHQNNNNNSSSRTAYWRNQQQSRRQGRSAHKSNAHSTFNERRDPGAFVDQDTSDSRPVSRTESVLTDISSSYLSSSASSLHVPNNAHPYPASVTSPPLLLTSGLVAPCNGTTPGQAQLLHSGPAYANGSATDVAGIGVSFDSGNVSLVTGGSSSSRQGSESVDVTDADASTSSSTLTTSEIIEGSRQPVEGVLLGPEGDHPLPHLIIHQGPGYLHHPQEEFPKTIVYHNEMSQQQGGAGGGGGGNGNPSNNNQSNSNNNNATPQPPQVYHQHFHGPQQQHPHPQFLPAAHSGGHMYQVLPPTPSTVFVGNMTANVNVMHPFMPPAAASAVAAAAGGQQATTAAYIEMPQPPQHQVGGGAPVLMPGGHQEMMQQQQAMQHAPAHHPGGHMMGSGMRGGRGRGRGRGGMNSGHRREYGGGRMQHQGHMQHMQSQQQQQHHHQQQQNSNQQQGVGGHQQNGAGGGVGGNQGQQPPVNQNQQPPEIMAQIIDQQQMMNPSGIIYYTTYPGYYNQIPAVSHQATTAAQHATGHPIYLSAGPPMPMYGHHMMGAYPQGMFMYPTTAAAPPPQPPQGTVVQTTGPVGIITPEYGNFGDAGTPNKGGNYTPGPVTSSAGEFEPQQQQQPQAIQEDAQGEPQQQMVVPTQIWTPSGQVPVEYQEMVVVNPNQQQQQMQSPDGVVEEYSNAVVVDEQFLVQQPQTPTHHTLNPNVANFMPLKQQQQQQQEQMGSEIYPENGDQAEYLVADQQQQQQQPQPVAYDMNGTPILMADPQQPQMVFVSAAAPPPPVQVPLNIVTDQQQPLGGDPTIVYSSPKVPAVVELRQDAPPVMLQQPQQPPMQEVPNAKAEENHDEYLVTLVEEQLQVASAKQKAWPQKSSAAHDSNNNVPVPKKQVTTTSVAVTAVPGRSPMVSPKASAEAVNGKPEKANAILQTDAPQQQQKKLETNTVSVTATPAAINGGGEKPAPPSSWASLFASSQKAAATATTTTIEGMHANGPVVGASAKKPVAKVLPFAGTQVQASVQTTGTAAGAMSYSAASSMGLSTNSATTVSTSTAEQIDTMTSAADRRGVKLGEFFSKYQIDNTTVSLNPRGLTNRSNYCYINAIVQALVACPPFYHLMKQIRQETPGFKEKSTTPIIDAMVDLVNEFTPLTQTMRLNRREKGPKGKEEIELNCPPPFEPTVIHKILNSRGNGFKVEGRQEDAEEFLSYLLNGLNDEMLELMKMVEKPVQNGVEAVNGGSEPANDEDDDWQVIVNNRNKGTVTRTTDFGRTPISDIFRGQVRSRLQREGDHSTDVIQPFFTLQLDIEKADSVKEALEVLVVKDKLEGVTCTKTNQEVAAWQQYTLEKLPVVLVLHLKLFDYTMGGCTKILKTVAFPIELKIEPKILSSKKYQAKQKQQQQYKLFAIVYHDGKEASKGHYITDVYNVAYSSWIRYDDSMVRPVREHQVLNPKAPRVPYLLYYRRCDTITPVPSQGQGGGGGGEHQKQQTSSSSSGISMSERGTTTHSSRTTSGAGGGR